MKKPKRNQSKFSKIINTLLKKNHFNIILKRNLPKTDPLPELVHLILKTKIFGTEPSKQHINFFSCQYHHPLQKVNQENAGAHEDQQ